MRIDYIVRGVVLAPVAGMMACLSVGVHESWANARSGTEKDVIEWSHPDNRSEEPILLIVSLDKQTIRVFSGDKLVKTSNVSSGKDGHRTPTGVFSILEKRRHHKSNIYSQAPMPYMQRLTWSGVALHESDSVPDQPASHGCVRLPEEFARQLFGYTDIGAHVIIVGEEKSPFAITHDNLFYPPVEPAAEVAGDPQEKAKMSSVVEQASLVMVSSESTANSESDVGSEYSLRSGVDVKDPVEAAKKEPEFAQEATDPVRILISRRTGRELVRDIQVMLNELGFNAGKEDGWMGPATSRAIIRFEKSLDLDPTGTLSMDLARKLHEASGRGPFKSGHIYVRRNFKSVFDAPVDISEPEKPLGAHFLSALAETPGEDRIYWQSLSLPDQPQASILSEIVFSEDGRTAVSSDIAEALDRIEMPPAIRERINGMIVAGSSLAISDEGLSRETTDRGTDFILVTRPPEAE
ncbi:L,D-transpeptidase family protein [Hoeflea sp. CAU 1731]